MKLSKFIRLLKAAYNRPLCGAGNWNRGALILRPWKLGAPAHLQLEERVSIDKYAWIEGFSRYRDFAYSPTIRIGRGTTIGRYFCLTAIDRVEIGDDCLISEHVYISDHFHGTHPENGSPVEQALESKGPVRIGDGCFIGYRACILSGVSLGNNCVVGANSVVTRSFPSHCMIAGSPARLIKRYSAQSKSWESVPPEAAPHAE